MIPGSLSALYDLYRKAGFSFSILQDTLPKTAYRHLPRKKVAARHSCGHVCARNPVGQGSTRPVLTFLPCSLFHLWFHGIHFAQRNNKREKKQSVPTLLGLGILMRKPKLQGDRDRFLSFSPLRQFNWPARKTLQLCKKNSKRSAIG